VTDGCRPMAPSRLLHEPVYLLLWLGLGVALASTGEAVPSDFALLAGQAVVLLFLRAKGQRGAWLQARLWFPFIALNLTYFWLGDAIPRLREWRADTALLEIDRLLFGDCPAIMVAPSVHGWSRDLLSVSYLSYFPLWMGAFVVATRKGMAFQRSYFSGFHLVHGIGFAGYTLFPAAGPFRYAPLADRIAPSPAGPLTDFNNWIVSGACNGVDVFPSLHTAVTLFILLSASSISRRLFAILLLPCLLIFTATIGLQYHYVADLAAGALLATTVWWFTTRPKNFIPR
jgi:hypothetical protein